MQTVDETIRALSKGCPVLHKAWVRAMGEPDLSETGRLLGCVRALLEHVEDLDGAIAELERSTVPPTQRQIRALMIGEVEAAVEASDPDKAYRFLTAIALLDTLTLDTEAAS